MRNARATLASKSKVVTVEKIFFLQEKSKNISLISKLKAGSPT